MKRTQPTHLERLKTIPDSATDLDFNISAEELQKGRVFLDALVKSVRKSIKNDGGRIVVRSRDTFNTFDVSELEGVSGRGIVCSEVPNPLETLSQSYRGRGTTLKTLSGLFPESFYVEHGFPNFVRVDTTQAWEHPTFISENGVSVQIRGGFDVAVARLVAFAAGQMSAVGDHPLAQIAIVRDATYVLTMNGDVEIRPENDSYFNIASPGICCHDTRRFDLSMGNDIAELIVHHGLKRGLMAMLCSIKGEHEIDMKEARCRLGDHSENDVDNHKMFMEKIWSDTMREENDCELDIQFGETPFDMIHDALSFHDCRSDFERLLKLEFGQEKLDTYLAGAGSFRAPNSIEHKSRCGSEIRFGRYTSRYARGMEEPMLICENIGGGEIFKEGKKGYLIEDLKRLPHELVGPRRFDRVANRVTWEEVVAIVRISDHSHFDIIGQLRVEQTGEMSLMKKGFVFVFNKCIHSIENVDLETTEIRGITTMVIEVGSVRERFGEIQIDSGRRNKVFDVWSRKER